jgi:hypothetical protein
LSILTELVTGFKDPVQVHGPSAPRIVVDEQAAASL